MSSGKEVFGPPGFCVRRDIRRVPADVMSRLSRYPVAIIGDGMGRRGVMDAAIKPLSPNWKLCGPAVTVEVRPGDNLMMHVALAVVQPGDVLVVNAHGNLSCGLWGGIMHAIAAKRGLAGLVIDGAVRDSLELVASGIPVFARGINPCGGDKEGPGQVNFPIACGGVPILPGDAIVGDADGVIVVPAERASDAVAASQQRIDAEKAWLERIAAGELVLPFVVPNLRRYGVLGADETI